MIRTSGESNVITPFSKYIRISNFDRVSGTPSEFAVDLSNDFNIKRATSIWTVSCSLPHKFSNIYYNSANNNNNNLYLFAQRAVPAANVLVFVTVPPGQYTVNQLMTTLQNLINPILVSTFGVGSSITFTLNPITNKIEYTITNFDTIQFLNSVNVSTIAYVLGFTNDTIPAASGSLPFIPNLSGPSMVFLHSQEFNGAGTFLSTNRPVSTFCAIPIKVAYLDTIYYESIGSMQDYINLKTSKTISTVNIKVRGQDGSILQLGDNDELIITLKVFYET